MNQVTHFTAVKGGVVFSARLERPLQGVITIKSPQGALLQRYELPMSMSHEIPIKVGFNVPCLCEYLLYYVDPQTGKNEGVLLGSADLVTLPSWEPSRVLAIPLSGDRCLVWVDSEVAVELKSSVGDQTFDFPAALGHRFEVSLTEQRMTCSIRLQNADGFVNTELTLRGLPASCRVDADVAPWASYLGRHTATELLFQMHKCLLDVPGITIEQVKALQEFFNGKLGGSSSDVQQAYLLWATAQSGYCNDTKLPLLSPNQVSFFRKRMSEMLAQEYRNTEEANIFVGLSRLKEAGLLDSALSSAWEHLNGRRTNQAG